jgi:N-acetylglutamate synthase-like GNAT family acetyltransferase
MDILENQHQLLPQFIQLNQAWITEHFKLEEVDYALAAYPERIIEEGGYVFCLHEQGQVIGTCALFHEGDGVYQLARMAVEKTQQGKGLGSVLMQVCLNKLTQLNAKRVYLISNTKLSAAISLYTKFGFQTYFEGQHPEYARANIGMEILF